jgi:hypothetical protein
MPIRQLDLSHVQYMTRQRTSTCQVLPPVTAILCAMPHPGQRQRGREAQYDPASGRNYRTGIQLPPDLAVKAIRAAELAGLSLAGYMAVLVKRDTVDDRGMPTWAREEAQYALVPHQTGAPAKRGAA